MSEDGFPKQNLKALLLAVKKQDIEQLEAWRSLYPSVVNEVIDDEGRSVIIQAITDRKVHVLKWLLANGVEVSKQAFNKQGQLRAEIPMAVYLGLRTKKNPIDFDMMEGFAKLGSHPYGSLFTEYKNWGLWWQLANDQLQRQDCELFKEWLRRFPVEVWIKERVHFQPQVPLLESKEDNNNLGACLFNGFLRWGDLEILDEWKKWVSHQPVSEREVVLSMLNYIHPLSPRVNVLEQAIRYDYKVELYKNFDTLMSDIPQEDRELNGCHVTWTWIRCFGNKITPFIDKTTWAQLRNEWNNPAIKAYIMGVLIQDKGYDHSPLRMLKWLHANSFDLKVQDGVGNTALHYLPECQRLQFHQALPWFDPLTEWVQKHLGVEAWLQVNYEGQTPKDLIKAIDESDPRARQISMGEKFVTLIDRSIETEVLKESCKEVTFDRPKVRM